MGSTNNGGQVISFSYKESAESQLFNNLNHKLLPRGVYSGGGFDRINDTTLRVSPLICVYDDDPRSVTARIETTTYATITVAPATPYIVLRYVWLNASNNYADFLSIQYSDILSSDIILGRLVFNSTVLTTEFDYSRKNWSSSYLNTLLGYTPDYLVVSNEPYDNKVTVYPGDKNIISGKVSQLLANTLSPAFSFPTGSNGRTDLVCLNENSQVIIVEGDNIVGSSVIPVIDDKYSPLAIVTFPASVSTVHGSYISYFNSKNFRSGQISGTNSSTFHLDRDNSGPILKNSGGVIQIRNTGDTDFSRISASNGVNPNDVVTMQQINSVHSTETLTSGTSWTVPSGVHIIYVTTIGGGGGGGGNGINNIGSTGGTTFFVGATASGGGGGGGLVNGLTAQGNLGIGSSGHTAVYYPGTGIYLGGAGGGSGGAGGGFGGAGGNGTSFGGGGGGGSSTPGSGAYGGGSGGGSGAVNRSLVFVTPGSVISYTIGAGGAGGAAGEFGAQGGAGYQGAIIIEY